MRSKRLELAFISFLLSCGSAFGQDSHESRESLSGLSGIAFYVIPPTAELTEQGLGKLTLSVELERCLREAGIPIVYPTPPDTIAQGPTLVLEVTASLDHYLNQAVYTIRLEFVQTVYLERDSTLGLFSAPTWSVSGTGVCMDTWRQAIIGDVVAFANQFAAAYAAANPAREE